MLELNTIMVAKFAELLDGTPDNPAVITQPILDSVFELHMKVQDEVHNGTVGRGGGFEALNLRDLEKFRDVLRGNGPDLANYYKLSSQTEVSPECA